MSLCKSQNHPFLPYLGDSVAAHIKGIFQERCVLIHYRSCACPVINDEATYVYQTFDARVCHRVEKSLRSNYARGKLNILIALGCSSQMYHRINAIESRPDFIVIPNIDRNK